MSALAFIGWLALLGVSGYAALAGLAFAYLTGGFTGRVSGFAVVLALLGSAAVVVVLLHAPFRLVWAS